MASTAHDFARGLARVLLFSSFLSGQSRVRLDRVEPFDTIET